MELDERKKMQSQLFHSIDNENTRFVRYLYHRSEVEKVNAFHIKAGQVKSDGETNVTADEAEQFNASVPDFFSEDWNKKNGQRIVKAYLVGSVTSSFALLLATKCFYAYNRIPGRLIPNVPVGLAFFAISQYCGIEAGINQNKV